MKNYLSLKNVDTHFILQNVFALIYTYIDLNTIANISRKEECRNQNVKFCFDLKFKKKN